MPFTSAPIHSRDELRLALKLAGDEARRVGSGSLTARQVRCDGVHCILRQTNLLTLLGHLKS